ncbi:MAG: FAD-dependent oxidoreductase [Bacillota bacterium]|nr:FAD-dependent oxidoreductase [Bacillota bacterium]
MSQIHINIDGCEITAYSGATIKEIAEQHGIDIPTLCYNKNLMNYASCGLCVVEIEGSNKLVRSCSTEATDGMMIYTKSKRVVESRKTTLELMLSNHVGDCKAPCTLGCPDQVDIQGYVGLTANGEFREALELIKKDLPLPASIGRVCPRPCQTACRRGLLEGAIQIAWIKRYVADLDLASDQPFVPQIAPSTGKRVAIVGGGPSGLSAAYFLRQRGHEVKVYEANEEFGGMLHYGIPMYRLPKDVLAAEVDLIRRMGVTLQAKTRLGEDFSLKYLLDNYDAVYLAIGAWSSSRLGIPGENLPGVFGGINFLTNFARNTPIRTGKIIAVIGGGNTAMDAARTSIRLGAEKVYILYRRTKEDMSAIDVEIIEAEEEGVEFRFLLSPVEFLGDEQGVRQVRLQRMRVERDEKSKRNQVIPIPDAFETLDVDSVILSIGQRPVLDGIEEIEVDESGQILVDPTTFQTSYPGVFAGGDVIPNKSKIAIQAIADGKHAASVMHSYLAGDLRPMKKDYFVVTKNVKAEDLPPVAAQPCAPMEHLAPAVRSVNFEEVVAGFTEKNAVLEGNRCLECGCMDYRECDLIRRTNQYDVNPERLAGEQSIFPRRSDHPYILHDPNKCILCGMCVRVCEEVMDCTALGLVGRGFGTCVQPAMGKPLSETDCISCGQCVAICPVGALQERRPVHKQVPLEAKVTESACFGCSVGCSMQIESRGGMLLRTLPQASDPVSGGLLCRKGRFDFDRYHPVARITKPMIRKNGVLVETDFDQAIRFLARKAQSIQLLYGRNALGIAINDRYTNEELFLAKKLAHEILNTDHIFSLGYRTSGLLPTLGADASTVRFEELIHTDLILCVGGDLYETHLMVALKLKKAVESGKKLICINSKSDKLKSRATQSLEVDDLVSFLAEICKSLLAWNRDPNLEGRAELEQALSSVVVRPLAEEIASAYRDVRKAIVVFDKERIDLAEQLLIADMAILSTHIGYPRSGILQLKDQVNSQGIADMGLGCDRESELAKIESGEIRAMISFGEELPQELIGRLSFLAVQTTVMTETARRADVILPAASLAETEGYVTSSERLVQRVRPSLEPQIPMTNFELFKRIMFNFDSRTVRISRESVLEEISAFNPDYRGIHHLAEDKFYWPIHGAVQLYQYGEFRTPSGKPILVAPATISTEMA